MPRSAEPEVRANVNADDRRIRRNIRERGGGRVALCRLNSESTHQVGRLPRAGRLWRAWRDLAACIPEQEERSRVPELVDAQRNLRGQRAVTRRVDEPIHGERRQLAD